MYQFIQPIRYGQDTTQGQFLVEYKMFQFRVLLSPIPVAIPRLKSQSDQLFYSVA